MSPDKTVAVVMVYLSVTLGSALALDTFCKPTGCFSQSLVVSILWPVWMPALVGFRLVGAALKEKP